ncbi:hypothetical protein EDD17DRAFT_1559150 [Pisolithus thermaeus]|nr:hypothetical protein EDD17DRAFT_1559150 [Pisolithus thermaeus]
MVGEDPEILTPSTGALFLIILLNCSWAFGVPGAGEAQEKGTIFTLSLPGHTIQKLSLEAAAPRARVKGFIRWRFLRFVCNVAEFRNRTERL